MFKKLKRKINHPKKPSCYTCDIKWQCDYHYASCHEHTGFVTPCFSCKDIGICIMYKLASKRQKPIYECPQWINGGY